MQVVDSVCRCDDTLTVLTHIVRKLKWPKYDRNMNILAINKHKWLKNFDSNSNFTQKNVPPKTWWSVLRRRYMHATCYAPSCMHACMHDVEYDDYICNAIDHNRIWQCNDALVLHMHECTETNISIRQLDKNDQNQSATIYRAAHVDITSQARKIAAALGDIACQ